MGGQQEAPPDAEPLTPTPEELGVSKRTWGAQIMAWKAAIQEQYRHNNEKEAEAFDALRALQSKSEITAEDKDDLLNKMIRGQKEETNRETGVETKGLTQRRDASGHAYDREPQGRPTRTEGNQKDDSKRATEGYYEWL